MGETEVKPSVIKPKCTVGSGIPTLFEQWPKLSMKVSTYNQFRQTSKGALSLVISVSTDRSLTLTYRS